MRKISDYWLFAICFLLFTSCSEKKAVQSVSPEIPLLDMEATMTESVPDTFVWNNLVKQSELIPLQTTDNALMSGAARVEYIGDDCLFIVDYQTASFYKFDRKGNLLKSYRYLGNGPGEYVGITRFFFDPVRHTIDVYDDDGRKRIRYDEDGKLMEETSLGDLAVPEYVSSRYLICSGMPDTEYQLYIVDPDLKELGKCFPLIGEEYNEVRRSAIQLLSSHCANKDQLLIARPMTDTVYTVTDKAVEPLFVLKKGKYDIAFTDLDRFMTAAMKTMTCLMWPRVSSIPGHYLMEYQREGNKYQEIWDIEKRQVISRNSVEEGTSYLLPSGKEVRVSFSKMYIDGNTLLFLLPAEELEGEVEGVNAEDNPVLLVLSL